MPLYNQLFSRLSIYTNLQSLNSEQNILWPRGLCAVIATERLESKYYETMSCDV